MPGMLLLVACSAPKFGRNNLSTEPSYDISETKTPVRVVEAELPATTGDTLKEGIAQLREVRDGITLLFFPSLTVFTEYRKALLSGHVTGDALGFC